MKTGIVITISQGSATLLCPGGEFISRKTDPSWEVGQVVPLKATAPPQLTLLRKISALAASLVVLCVATFAGYFQFFAVDSVISLDINPSLELSLNRRGEVLFVQGKNDEGTELATAISVQGKPYEEAISLLLSSAELAPYLTRNTYLSFAVFSKTREAALLTFLATQTEALAQAHPHLTVDCTGVTADFVEEAHTLGVTPGKLRALIELQSLNPSIALADYKNESMSTLRRLIRELGGEAPPGEGKGAGQGKGPRGDEDTLGNSQRGQGKGQQGQGTGLGKGKGQKKGKR